MNVPRESSVRVRGAPRTMLVALVMVICGLMHGGCSSSSAISARIGTGPTVPKGASIVVATTSEVPAAEKVAPVLHSLVIAELGASGVVRAIDGASGASAAAPYRLTLRITRLRGVSDGLRVMVGALAGQASLDVAADLEGQGQRRSFMAKGVSSGGWVGAGTTDQALQKAAQAIVAEVLAVP